MRTDVPKSRDLSMTLKRTSLFLSRDDKVKVARASWLFYFLLFLLKIEKEKKTNLLFFLNFLGSKSNSWTSSN